jgi:hypothetical protein
MSNPHIDINGTGELQYIPNQNEGAIFTM